MAAIFIVLVLVIMALVYIFCTAFVRGYNKDVEKMTEGTTGFLCGYKDLIKKGIEFINSTEHKDVYINSFDGLKLHGCYYEHQGSEKTIIIFHGYRSAAKRDFSCAVEMYLNFGFNVLLVDQRSHGKSEGRLITYGIKERFDVKFWIDYVINTYGEKVQIFLGGLSMGATTVVMSLGCDLPHNVKGVIADSGFSSPWEIIGRVSEKTYKISSKISLPLIDFMAKIIGRFSIYDVDCNEVVKKNKIPILFIHGDGDSFVPCDMTREMYKNNLGDKRLVIVEKADHGCAFLVDQVLVKKELGDFFNSYSK